MPRLPDAELDAIGQAMKHDHGIILVSYIGKIMGIHFPGCFMQQCFRAGTLDWRAKAAVSELQSILSLDFPQNAFYLLVPNRG